MTMKIRLLFVGTILALFVTGSFAVDDVASSGHNDSAPVVVAAANTGSSGGTSSGYADCMNGCWRSHRYCQRHQSKQMDCNRQLGQCIEFCESSYDPQFGGAGGVFAP